MTKGLKKLFWKSKEQAAQDNDTTLSDIIRGLQHCVNQSREIASLQYITDIKNFLDETGKPFHQTVRIGENGVMDVPLMCLLNHDALELDEMEVDLDITLKNMALKKPMPVSDDPENQNKDELGHLSRTAFVVDLNSAKIDGSYTKLGLKLKFKADSPPEAVSRIIEKLNGQVSVHLLPETNKRVPEEL